MRWIHNAPGGPWGDDSAPGVEYCHSACMPVRRSRDICAECPANDLHLLPENETAADLYLLCAKQWRVNAMGGRIGLDMPGVRAVAEPAGITIDRPMLRKLQWMEDEVLSIERDRDGNDQD